MKIGVIKKEEEEEKLYDPIICKIMCLGGVSECTKDALKDELKH